MFRQAADIDRNQRLVRARGKAMNRARDHLFARAAAAGNEAGGVLTYSQIGATHGYGMLWLLVLTTISLIVAQEMGTRMGLITGKGLADLIREQFGVRVAVFAMLVLLVANLFTTLSEFAGIAASLELLIPVPGIRYFAVPLLGILLWLLVLR